ncbi:MAG: tRNA (adenosine(37)-N6)-threonylcarbamoyltransferase complex dimerization subunit type 1 TsaB [Omnitrophica WOR_2 bacterium RIFCSPHIGHO2_02_FULL_45_21]|nr:MAG: tRNA (adenosine(37)-N6)-threonylcarbamoyltransferase complex dimerization subunit type 1 TsaB [Omnitrophica WOR_2 bacterium RIFCSPHIGHO2_02_FULL_45_21]
MNILAIDTSSKYLCLSIAKDDKIVAGIRRSFAGEMSEKIIPSIDSALRQSKLSLKAIDYFGIGLGPGSFTGLRIGLAAIKGLAFPFNKPIVGVGSLDLLASAVTNHSALICPILDARRSLLYAAIYQGKNAILIRKTSYLLVSIEELLERLKPKDKVIFLGDGLKLYSGVIKNKLFSLAVFADENLWYPKPEVLLSCVKERIVNRQFLNLHKLVPIYLYPKECQIIKSS